jgi:hypothetical protein
VSAIPPSSFNANGGRTVDPTRAAAPRSPAASVVDPTPRATAPAVRPTAPAAAARSSAASSGCSLADFFAPATLPCSNSPGTDCL